MLNGESKANKQKVYVKQELSTIYQRKVISTKKYFLEKLK